MGGRGDSANWRQNASVLIHEATHQTAFNTGIHSRYSPPPAWLAEGLAMLFEAPGVHDSHNYTRLADRVNRERLRVFQQTLAPRHRPEMLASIVASDELFRVNPSAAYAEAWALSFFLIETQPRQYVQYLKRTASLPPFQEYTPARADGRFRGPLRRRLADAGGPVPAIHGCLVGGDSGRLFHDCRRRLQSPIGRQGEEIGDRSRLLQPDVPHLPLETPAGRISGRFPSSKLSAKCYSSDDCPCRAVICRSCWSWRSWRLCATSACRGTLTPASWPRP